MTETVTPQNENFEIVTESTQAETAYGNKLATPLPYSFDWERLLKFDAIPAKEMPDNDDVLAVVNNARKAASRQKALSDALDKAGIKKPVVDDSAEGKLLGARNMVKTMVAMGTPEAQAIQQVEALTGLKLS